MADPAKLAASALAAYTSAPAMQASQQTEEHPVSAPPHQHQHPPPSFHHYPGHPASVHLASVYQNQAIEALRRQEEFRLLQLHQQGIPPEYAAMSHHPHQRLPDGVPHQYADADEEDEDDDDEEEEEEDEDDDDDEEDDEMPPEQLLANLKHGVAAAAVYQMPPAQHAAAFGRYAHHDAMRHSEAASHAGNNFHSPHEKSKVNVQGIHAMPHTGGKPEALATAIAQANLGTVQDEEPVVTTEPVTSEEPVAESVLVISEQSDLPADKQKNNKKKVPSKKSTKSPGSSKKKSSSASSMNGPTIHDSVPDITPEEYKNVEALMVQFCRVPLLAEFSRPVSLLHPELMTVYSKVVRHPIDLSKVCRGIRRKTYKNTRDIQMDMWRIFANCVKYHTHPSNKDNAVPAFISIALHLREYFNALWEEFMMPSDPPAILMSGNKLPKGSMAAQMKKAFENREKGRQQRIASTCTTMLSSKCLQRLHKVIDNFQKSGGIVDCLDKNEIFGADIEDEEGEMESFLEMLTSLKAKLRKTIEDDSEYTFDELNNDVKKCYTDIFPSRPTMRVTVENRLNRLIGKIIVPIYETGCRGVNQSSIWGCMAAAIWARESTKKPYWPALVLGIMAPEEQREDWHHALTIRNEGRLPEKLRNELLAGKRRAEQALKRQVNLGAHEQMSFFLVEFMGTHEFIWVKESDIIESLDPDDDPNQAAIHGNITKKKRSRLADSKTFMAALEEGRWALEEFEMQLSDSCGDLAEEALGQEEEMNYSYSILCQSDDDNESEDEQEMTMSDVEEANELLQNTGLLDFSVEGRKAIKKRALARKKEKANAERAAAKKEKDQQAKKAKAEASKKRTKARLESQNKRKQEKEREKQEKKEQRELEKRRKKRVRERERVLKAESRKKKRRNSEGSLLESKLAEKRGRATAIVKGYLTRIAEKEDLKNLCIAGVLNIPASVVDSQGLLGMALAFRAAAGEFPMPDSGTDVSRYNAWDKYDIDSPKSSEERSKNLKKQVEMLQERISQTKAATVRRIQLTKTALEEKAKHEAEVLDLDKKAKQMIMSREKNKSKAKPAKSDQSTMSKSDDEGEEKENVLEGTVVEADAAEEGKVTVVEVVSSTVQANGELFEAEAAVAMESEEIEQTAVEVDGEDADGNIDDTEEVEPVEAAVVAPAEDG